MTVSAVDLAWMLRDARRRTLDLIADLSDEQLVGPRLDIVNPLLWELGHVAWFQERWVLRRTPGTPSIRDDADANYDSAGVRHDVRWDLHLPARDATLRYAQDVLDRAVHRIESPHFNDEDAYFGLLAIYHEDMHDEAFVYTRQTLACSALSLPTRAVESLLPLPSSAGEECRGEGRMAADVACEIPLTPTLSPEAGRGRSGGAESPSNAANGVGAVFADAPLPGDVELGGGRFMLGSARQMGFVFDNEKWAHSVYVAPFGIARAPVTNAQFAEFVESRGYERREFWSDAGSQWRTQASASHPVYWQRQSNGRWLVRQYDQFVPLHEHLPIIHVNWFEANAYCRWAGRRLPTEAEWELAAAIPPSGNAKRLYPWGDSPPTPDRANLDLRSIGCVAVNQHAAGDSAAGCRQMIGNVWEWTASDFEPYPGFSVDPYKEYSQPWFGGTHKVLRGGAYATRSRMIRSAYRNFYTPDRRDVLAGFRTCR
jgi:iron(II)-dependent oxidoreductase